VDNISVMNLSKFCHCGDFHETGASSTSFVNKTYGELNENLTNGLVVNSISQLDKNMNGWTLCECKALIDIHIKCDVSMTVHHWYNNINSQLGAAITQFFHNHN